VLFHSGKMRALTQSVKMRELTQAKGMAARLVWPR
jgi:hypothetical protein